MSWDSLPPSLSLSSFSCLHTVSEGRNKEHVFSSSDTECHELNCVPTKPMCWSPGHQWDGMRTWHVWEIIRFRWDHKCAALMMGLVDRKRPETSLSLNVWFEERPGEKTATRLQVRKRAPIRTNHAGTLISDLQPLEPWENTSVV